MTVRATPLLRNATLVLPHSVSRGAIAVENGRIAGIEPGASGAGEDCEGDYLIPGIVDLHTDNLERQVQPRGGARWPSRSALLAHDAICAASGITTVLDALCVGDLGFDRARLRTLRDGLIDLDALAPSGVLKCDHALHLRCELPATDMLDLLAPIAANPRIRMVSLMDHSPGVGQNANIARYRANRAAEGMGETEIERHITDATAQRAFWRPRNRRALLDLFRQTTIVLASHDDETEAEIAENHADGISVSEFPVTLAAAAAARVRGMRVIAGAPNIVRGGSHCGNVAAIDLIRAGTVDALASDYVPAAMIEAAFAAARDTGLSLPDAIALVTDRPARMIGLADRGRIEPGLRADLTRVHLHEGLPVVRAVWREGVRIA